MADDEKVSVAGVLSAIAAGFPATETPFITDAANVIQIMQANPRRIGFIISNTCGNNVIITTQPGSAINAGFQVINGTNERFSVKDWGGLVMMGWWMQPTASPDSFVTVFEVYSTRG